MSNLSAIYKFTYNIAPSVRALGVGFALLVTACSAPNDAKLLSDANIPTFNLTEISNVLERGQASAQYAVKLQATQKLSPKQLNDLFAKSIGNAPFKIQGYVVSGLHDKIVAMSKNMDALTSQYGSMEELIRQTNAGASAHYSAKQWQQKITQIFSQPLGLTNQGEGLQLEDQSLTCSSAEDVKDLIAEGGAQGGATAGAAATCWASAEGGAIAGGVAGSEVPVAGNFIGGLIGGGAAGAVCLAAWELGGKAVARGAQQIYTHHCVKKPTATTSSPAPQVVAQPTQTALVD